MKLSILPALLLLAGPAVAQMTPPPPTEAELRASGAESPRPFTEANVIVSHSTESAEEAYKKALATLLAAGYSVDRNDKDAFFISTTAKPLQKGVYLKLLVVATPEATGSAVSFRGTFTWLSAITTMAKVQDRVLPVEYRGTGNNPVARAWQALQAAADAFGGQQLAYKRIP